MDSAHDTLVVRVRALPLLFPEFRDRGLEVLQRVERPVDAREPQVGDEVEFLQRARRLHPHAIRILTTAYPDYDLAIDAVNSAAIYKYVTKPWDIPELEAILEQACQAFTLQREQDLDLRAQVSEPQPPATGNRGAKFEDLKTPEQIARYLNINKFTVYRLVTEKKIPAFKVGNQWRFKQEMIDAWMMAKSNIGKKKTN